MTHSEAYDAIVIGAGVNGLAAAAYLAGSGKRVVVVEARATRGGLCEMRNFGDDYRISEGAHALYALDPVMVRELKLAQHGLAYAARDMPLVGLRADGKHIVLSRNAPATTRSIAVHSEADARSWARFRRDWFGLARKMRGLWWDMESMTAARLPALGDIRKLARSGTAAFLDSWFESDALKAAFGFDAQALSPLAAGSALLLLWRAAQEMCGLEGAVALPVGGLGAVSDALARVVAMAGIEIRLNSAVSDILVDDKQAKGVLLASGGTLMAPLVLSSLSRRQTLSFGSTHAALDFAQAARLDREKPQVATARVTLGLAARPEIRGAVVPAIARYVIAERLDNLAAAHAAASAGRLPEELTMEAIMPAAVDAPLAPESRYIVSVLVTPVPAVIDGGWPAAKSVLAANVVAALGRHIPGLSRNLVAIDVLTPDDARERFGVDDAFGGRVTAERLLAGWRERLATPVAGLVICGASADPVGAVSGRSGRLAAKFACKTGGRL